MALSLPIPKNKKQKIPVTFFPIDLEDGKTVKKFKLSVEKSETVAGIKDKIKEFVGTQNEIILYNLKRRNQLDGKLNDEVPAYKLEDEKLVAYEYNISFSGKKCCLIPVMLTKESRSMFGNSNDDDVCEPKVFLASIDQTCTELKRMIFKYFFPCTKLPAQYQELYDGNENKEKMFNKIYEAFYNTSTHGENKVFRFLYEKEKSNYSSFRKYEKFEDSEKTLGDFIEELDQNSDFCLKIYFPKETKVSLDPLEVREEHERTNVSVSIDD